MKDHREEVQAALTVLGYHHWDSPRSGFPIGGLHPLNKKRDLGFDRACNRVVAGRKEEPRQSL